MRKVTDIVILSMFILFVLTAASCSERQIRYSREIAGSFDRAPSESADVAVPDAQADDIESDESTDGSIVAIATMDYGEEDSEESEDEDSDERIAEGSSGSDPDPSTLPPGYELIPEGWPDYIPVMVEFTVKYSGADETGMQVVAFGQLASEEVTAFYTQIPEWDLIDHLTSRIDEQEETGETWLTFTLELEHEDERLTVNIIDTEEERILQLLYKK